MKMRIETVQLLSVDAEILHCGIPMRYVRGLTTWEGKPKEGFTHETVERRCECGAVVVVKTSTPS